MGYVTKIHKHRGGDRMCVEGELKIAKGGKLIIDNDDEEINVGERVNRLSEEIAEQKKVIEGLTNSETTVLTNDDFFPGFWTINGLGTAGASGLLKTHQYALPTSADYTLHINASDLSNLTITATKYNADGKYSGFGPEGATIENGEYVLPPSDACFIRIAVAKFVDGAYVSLPEDALIWVTSSNSNEVNYKLFDSIYKPIDFTGEMLAYGDSITAGVTSPDLEVTENSYIKLLATHTGMTLTNRAISGAYITDADDTSNSIYKRVTSWTGAADVIIIAGGTNDYAFGKPLGVYGSTDTKTFYGALRGICEHLKANYPESTVIFITPIPHTIERDAAILPINAYRNAIYEIATSYEYNVVDGSTLGMPDRMGDWENTMIANGDNCHPTEAGHKLYFRGLCGKLL